MKLVYCADYVSGQTVGRKSAMAEAKTDVACQKLRRVEPVLLRFTRVHQLQLVALENALNLVFGMHCPRPSGVKLYVSAPVLQRLAGFTHFLVGKCNVVMRVGVSRSQLNRRFISIDRVLYASGLI